jgi:hypothetical protein
MLNEKVKDLLKNYNNLLEKVKQIIYDKYNKQVEKYKKEWTQKRESQYLELRNMIRTQECKENDCCKELEELMKKLISNGEKEINDYYNDIYTKQMNAYNEELELLKKTFEKDPIFEKNLKNALNKLNSELENNNAIDINKFKDTNLDETKIVYTLNLQSLHFDLSSNTDSEIKIRGGCLSKINKNVILIEKNIEKDLYQNIINQNNKEYIFIKSSLVNSPAYGDTLKNLVKNNYNLNQSDLIDSVINKRDNNKKDFSGFSKGHYKVLLGDSKSISSSDLNVKSESGITPELIAVTNGNHKCVSNLLKLNYSNFSSPSYNGITPLLSALLNKDKEMINLLLDYPDKIGDINYTNELDMTPLHYACLYNMPEIANKLIMENAAINAKEKKNGNTPLYLLCENSNIETLEYILENNNIDQYISIQRPDKKTPFI